jgi:hypothetical protein
MSHRKHLGWVPRWRTSAVNCLVDSRVRYARFAHNSQRSCLAFWIMIFKDFMLHQEIIILRNWSNIVYIATALAQIVAADEKGHQLPAAYEINLVCWVNAFDEQLRLRQHLTFCLLFRNNSYDFCFIQILELYNEVSPANAKLKPDEVEPTPHVSVA